MQLDERCLIILEEIITNPGIKIKDLEKVLSLTRRKVVYSLEKINDWLLINHLPLLSNHRSQGIVADPSIVAYVSLQPTAKTIVRYIPNDLERIYYIAALIMTKTDSFSLLHLSSSLFVSKNTILTDLKKLDLFLQTFNIRVHYSRMEGYEIIGKEFAIRKCLHTIIQKLITKQDTATLLVSLLNIGETELDEWKRKCILLEDTLHITFTDEKLNELPILFSILKKRLQQGNTLEQTNDAPILHSIHPKAHHVIQLLMPDEALHVQEMIYLTLQIFCSSTIRNGLINDHQWNELRSAINTFITIFEKRACVSFQDKEAFQQKLFQHLLPAYYRITYEIQLENPLLEQILNEYPDIHYLIKQSIYPIEQLLAKPLPEAEVAYITIITKSWLHQYGDSVEEKLKAVVVCPNGVSISKLLFENLRELFPEIIFLDHLSIRQFEGCHLHFDVVFSTVYVSTSKKMFVTKQLLTEEDRGALQRRVAKELNGMHPSTIDYSHLLSRIEKYATVHDKKRLLQSLEQYFNHTQPSTEQHALVSNQPDLSQLLTADYIQQTTELVDWRAAIELASRPLLAKDKISLDYIHAMQSIITQHGPYMLLAPGAIMPHAKPEDGVHSLGMSLLVCKEPVLFPDNTSIHIVIIIAACDYERHLNALSQLNNLFADNQFTSMLLKQETTKSIYTLLCAR